MERLRLTVTGTGAGGAPVALQVGSFRDPDNAHHMVADLQALGLTAESVKDGEVLRIVVRLSEDLTAEHVHAVLESAGFQGVAVSGE